MKIAGVVLVLVGLCVVMLAIRSWQGRLSRNYVAGVRTPATVRSDEAFLIANKVAAPFSLVGGLVFAITGVITALVTSRVAVVVALAGVVLAALVIAVGGVKGVRAARATP